MTKRELVKWLEANKDIAMGQARNQYSKIVNEVKELEYKDIDLDGFVDSVVPLYQQILKKYEDFIAKVEEVHDIHIAQYYYRFGYNDLVRYYTNTNSFKDVMKDTIRIETKRFYDTKSAANAEAHKVEKTYDTVIQTVKNLPTYKDGLEYLKKLGFNLAEIQSTEQKKQLPATISVNVDTQYLLLGKDKTNEHTDS